jgi:hypothetical protein
MAVCPKMEYNSDPGAQVRRLILRPQLSVWACANNERKKNRAGSKSRFLKTRNLNGKIIKYIRDFHQQMLKKICFSILG